MKKILTNDLLIKKEKRYLKVIDLAIIYSKMEKSFFFSILRNLILTLG